MTDSQIELVTAVVTALFGIVIATGTLVWFMADKFKKNRAEFWRGLTELHNTVMSEMDNHEKKDDLRFEALTNQIWKMEVAQARRNGEASSERPPRR